MRKLFFIIMLLSYSIVFSQVQSTFTNDLEYWRVEGDSDFEWSNTGNPGGCLKIDDYAVGDINRALAPVKFLGDWTNTDTLDYISADIYLNSYSSEYIGEDVNYVFEISGPNGTARALYNPTPTNHSWTTLTVNLKPSEWNIISGNWNDILSDVEELTVSVEYIEGDESDKLDNVYISFSPIQYPVAIGTISDFEQPGFDGWYFKNVSGISNENTGGNPHRFVLVEGTSEFTFGVAPPKFSGSWTNLEGNAAILTDLKKISTNTNWHSPPYLFKISNENSSAIYPVPSDFTLKLNQWVTVSAMIEESDWTVISGTWQSLMQNIQEVKVALDFYNTQSTIGIDNFRVDNQPPQVYFTSDKRDIYPGTQIHFNDFSTNSPYAWYWNFGDGTSSTLQNPFHIYNTIGNYSVSLTATNQFGSGSLTKDNFITVYDPNDDFEDDFEDGRINDLWQFIRGNWREENGYLEQTSNTGSGEDFNQGCFAILGQDYWTDYEIRADLLNLDNEGIGLVICFQDLDNFYLFHWDNSTYSHAAIYKYEDGNKTLLDESTMSYDANTIYHVNFSYVDDKLQVMIDDNLVLSWINSSKTISEGKSGLWCSGSTGARYYDYKVLFKPEKPSDVVLTRSGNSVTLQWNPVHNAAYYNVYSSDDDNTYILETEGVSTTSWTGTFTNEHKFFKITAVK